MLRICTDWHRGKAKAKVLFVCLFFAACTEMVPCYVRLVNEGESSHIIFSTYTVPKGISKGLWTEKKPEQTRPYWESSCQSTSVMFQRDINTVVAKCPKPDENWEMISSVSMERHITRDICIITRRAGLLALVVLVVFLQISAAISDNDHTQQDDIEKCILSKAALSPAFNSVEAPERLEASPKLDLGALRTPHIITGLLSDPWKLSKDLLSSCSDRRYVTSSGFCVILQQHKQTRYVVLPCPEIGGTLLHRMDADHEKREILICFASLLRKHLDIWWK